MIPEIAPGAATLATPAPSGARRCYHAIQRDFSLPKLHGLTVSGPSAGNPSTFFVDTSRPPSSVSFSEALRFWLMLGFISFGGPAGQIAIMHRELVEQRRWISEKRFLHALNYCMLLPGPEAQQLATYIGWLMHRTWGGIVAGTLFVLPSLFILIKPAVAAIVLQAVQRIGSKALKTPARAPVLWAIALLSFVAIAFLKIPFPWVVLGAALTGWIGSRVALAQFASGGGHGAGLASSHPALIGDDTPTPPHARFNKKRLAQVLAAGALLWLLPMAALLAWQDWDVSQANTLAQMGWFFTKAALLTLAGPTRCCPTSTRAPSSTSTGSPARRWAGSSPKRHC